MKFEKHEKFDEYFIIILFYAKYSETHIEVFMSERLIFSHSITCSYPFKYG